MGRGDWWWMLVGFIVITFPREEATDSVFATVACLMPKAHGMSLLFLVPSAKQ